ncbi:hypothetical protein BH10CYA1_BH10CYA1_61740 [soil metagenome]
MKQSFTQRYRGKTAVLTTKHEKFRPIGKPILAGLGMSLVCPEGIDTDSLGTFSGEIERTGTPLQTAVRKARLGMSMTGLPFGFANEGSFAPHPQLFFIPANQEFMVFIDDQLGIEIAERIVSTETNFAHANVSSLADAEEYLSRVRFPSHGLIVRPHHEDKSLIDKVGRALWGGNSGTLIKGICDRALLAEAIDTCKAQSKDGLAQIETDMRAHMNPMRQRVIRKVAIKLVRRLQRTCAECDCPGWGITGAAGSLRCEECGYPSPEAPAFEIHSCAKCSYSENVPRQDGVTHVEATFCQRCNP